MDLEKQMSKQNNKELENLPNMVRVKEDWTLVNVSNVSTVNEDTRRLSFRNGEELEVDPEYWEAFITKFRSRQ